MSKAKKDDRTVGNQQVLYPEPKVKLLVKDKSMTAAMAKELLGWEEEGEKARFNDVYVHALKAVFGRKIRTTLNQHNRPWRVGNLLKLTQEILRGNWRLNGETRIIGQYGAVLNGQHTFAALIRAAELWAENPEDYPAWKTEPTIETAVIYGISEDIEVVNTLDTVEARTLADAFCINPKFRDYYSSLPEGKFRAATKALDSAVKLLWHRIGCEIDAFAPRRTHSEALHFVERHLRLLECVKHILEEDEGGKIRSVCSPGYAAGLLYLMGSYDSDSDAYHTADDPTEELLNWDKWDQACDFWVQIAGEATETLPIRQAISNLLEKNGSIRNAERWGLVCNAWQCVVHDEEITAEKIELAYKDIRDEQGNLISRVLDETPTAGGIDLGNPVKKDEATMPQPSEDEIAKVEERKARARAKKKAKETVLIPKKAGEDWAPGDVAWVKSPDGEHYVAEIKEPPYEIDGSDERRVIVADDQGEWEVDVANLSLERPMPKKVVVPPKAKEERTRTVKKKSARKLGEWKPGDLAWVREPSGEHRRGRIVELLGKSDKLRVEQGHRGSGNIRPVHVGSLSLTQPGAIPAT